MDLDEGILEKREEYHIFEIEMKNNERRITALRLRLYDLTIEWIDFEDSEFYNNLESLLVQWNLLDERDDFYIRNIFVKEDKMILEKKKLSNIWKSLNEKIKYLETTPTSDEEFFKNLLKVGEENRITNKRVSENLNILLHNESFLDSNSFYKKFKVRRFNSAEFLKIDKTIFESLNLFDKKKEEGNSVFSYIKKFVNTAMGRRVLRQWILQPSKKSEEIFYRQKTIKMYINNPEVLKIMDSFMEHLPDVDKILVRFLRFNNNLRNSAALKDCYQIYLFVRRLEEILPQTKKCAKSEAELFLVSVLEDIVGDLKGVADFVGKSIDLEKVEENNEFFINPDFSESLKTLDNQINKRKRYIERIKLELQEQLGDLKIVNNLKTGIIFETRKNNMGDDFQRKFKIITTRKNTITFTFSELEKINEELKELYLSYKNEQNNFIEKIIKFVATFYDAIETTNFIFIEQDILIGFAKLFSNPKDDNKFCFPTFLERPPGSNYQKLEIKKAWHPCVDFCISNDIFMEKNHTELLLITGPNMGGKSTYIRKIALCVLLAHVGCPVPADSCELTIFSSIYTRVGASDIQLKGISTFMNEMIETSNLLNNADQFSFLIIDELGRGTSIYEGLGISQAITEAILQKIGCFCLYATHFFELTKLAQKYPVVKNFSLQVHESEHELLFTYKLQKGPISKSYGIQILKNLHFPKEITDEAEDLVAILENIKITHF